MWEEETWVHEPGFQTLGGPCGTRGHSGMLQGPPGEADFSPELRGWLLMAVASPAAEHEL